MSRNVKTARPDIKLREIIRKLVHFNISSVIVLERERPVGIITEKNVLKSLAEGPLDIDVISAKRVMSGPLITVEEDANIEEASRLMIDNHIKKLPVMRRGKLVGVVTSSDIVRGTSMLTGSLKDICMIGKTFRSE